LQQVFSLSVFCSYVPLLFTPLQPFHNTLLTDGFIEKTRNENTDESLPYETISADDLLMTYTEKSFGRADRNSLVMRKADLAEIYLFQERYFINKYGESDLCGALERADAPRFAHYLRHHIIPHLPE